MRTLWQDLRFGARILLKQPGLMLIAVLSFSLSIGAQQAERTEEFLNTLRQAREKTRASDWNVAIPLWEKVVQLNPVTGEYWYQLADARYRNNDFRQAITCRQSSEPVEK